MSGRSLYRFNSSTKIHSSVNPQQNILIYYHGEDIPGYVPPRCLNMWTQPLCRIGRVAHQTTNERTSHGAVARDVSGSAGVIRSSTGKTPRGSIERDGSGYDGVTHMQSGVMAAIETMSRTASSNVNSPTRGSGLDNV